MRDLYSKTNAPYLIAGAVATLVLLASGTLAVAPYVEFLSSVAAFNVALPIALSLSILSILVLVLSCKMISQNKKLDAQKAEPNEKNGLAKEQENIIQSLEPQIKELNKRLSSQYNEIVKLIGSAAKKDEVEELISSFTAKLDEISKQANNATTKGEMKELSKKLSDKMEKLIGSLITKEELEERLGSLIKKVEVKEELRMKFYEKDEERGKITFDDVILPNNIKQKLIRIYEPDALENGEGYILYGPPGTGKTMTAKAIASETRFKSAFVGGGRRGVMSNLLSEANTFYFIASSLATLTLLTSLALIVTSNVLLPLILALATLSVLVLALSYKIISNNKKIEVERNKFAQREQELENKITLEKEAEEAANKEVKNQLHELTREKQNLDKRAKKLNQKINESEAEREFLLKEKESLEKRLLSEQEEKLKLEISYSNKQLEERSGFIAELKMKMDNNKHLELENKELNDRIETLREAQKALREKKHELSEKIEALNKEKNGLSKEVEELREEQERLHENLDKLQCKIKEVNKEKKNLSKELKEKFEELDKANGLIENQSFELYGIRKDCDNEVKRLKKLLLERDSQIEDFLKEKEKQKNFAQILIRYVTDDIEELIRNNGGKAILDAIQILKSALQVEIARLLPDETPSSSPKDSGYRMR